MAWSVQLPIVSKSGATSAINAVSAAQCSFGDLVGAADTQFAASLSAAKAAAVAALAGLNGAATRVVVSFGGSHDHAPSAPLPGSAASQCWCELIETW